MEGRTDRRRPDLSSRQLLVLVGIGVAFVLFGTVLANWTTTGGGDTSLESATIETESGVELDATVYEPENVSSDDPAPAVVLIHGYTGDRGTMSSFATEFADRGYVAITVDQPGHGRSDPPAFKDGWGGPAALRYTRSLDIVDGDRIALVGHSMGGFAALAAAKDQPDSYESVVLIGSTWAPMEGVEGLPEANQTFPRNMAVVYSDSDEFGQAMWDVQNPKNVRKTEKLASAFGTEPPVETERVHGSAAERDRRVLESPDTIHTRLHLSSTVISDTLSWVLETTGGDTSVDTDNQRWQWAETGKVLAFIGGVGITIGATAVLWRQLRRRREETGETTVTDGGTRTDAEEEPAAGDSSSRYTETKRTKTEPSRGKRLLLAVLPALTIYPLYGLGTMLVPTTRLTHQPLTHGYLVWALGTAGLAAVVLRWRSDRPLFSSFRSVSLDRVSFAAPTAHATVAAAGGVGTLYVVIGLFSLVPGSGFRAWMVSLGTLTATRWVSAVVYVLPLTGCAISLSVALDRIFVLPRIRDILPAVLWTCGGLSLFLAVQYIPLLLGIGMPVPALGPLAIIAIRATMVLAVVTAIATALLFLTDSPLPGGVCAGLVATWLFVLTSPIHVPPI